MLQLDNKFGAYTVQCPNDGGPGYPEDIVADGAYVVSKHV